LSPFTKFDIIGENINPFPAVLLNYFVTNHSGFNIFATIASMLSFLKKSTVPRHIDKVWKTRQGSSKGMMKEALEVIAKSGKPVIISWFAGRHLSLLKFLTKFRIPYILIDAREKMSAVSEIRTQNEQEWFIKNYIIIKNNTVTRNNFGTNR
jgi:hypothetical protein